MSTTHIPSNPEFRQAALHCLAEADARGKADGVRRLMQDYSAGSLHIDSKRLLTSRLPLPGRPAKPELVPPREVKRRSMQNIEGQAAMIHSLAHIEFNAINLALDAIWRFAGMPDDYYGDWLQVAAEEALHFTLLADHLESQGYRYGDFPAHDGLWSMADKTRDDLLARIALIPRTLEARGLDVSPVLRDKFAQAGDAAAAAILDVILRDEIGHVRIGNRWYAWLCQQRGLDPEQTYDGLAQQYSAPAMRGPFNLEARRAAGFTESELAALQVRR